MKAGLVANHSMILQKQHLHISVGNGRF